MTKPKTPDPELECRLRIVAGKLDGIEDVMRMVYEAAEPEQVITGHALLLLMNVAGEASKELHNMAGELEAHRLSRTDQ